jgi:glycosyltransferase involved in cell wall biosynthesis/peptidoglycan/xylan/chitin deacetylase (PgdA/CDA1 family)
MRTLDRTTSAPHAGRAPGGERRGGSLAQADLPSFSVVIPTHQRRAVVCDAVRALDSIDYTAAVEVIVIVDGSTDGTAEALRAVGCRFPVKIIEQPNAGAAAARNRGAEAARHDVILFLDDDMMCDPAILREHGRLHAEGAEAVIGETPIDPASGDEFLVESVRRWIASTKVRSPLSPFDIFAGQLSVRRSLFEQLGGFDSAFTAKSAFGSEDADLGARLLAGHDVRHNPAAVSWQRYSVSPRDYVARAERGAVAHVRFMRKHPELARELLERKGLGRPLTRWVYLPLSRFPRLARLIARLATGAAETALRTRFRSSRAVARFFSGACSLAYWSALRRSGWLPLSNNVLVLCYHAIRDQAGDPVLAPYGVAPEEFARQLDSLAARGFTFITPNQLVEFLRAGAPLPRRPVLLTFDDGYADLIDLARDVLNPKEIGGIAFIVTGRTANDWDQDYGAGAIDLLTSEQRAQLAALGVEIGSHSRTHRELRGLDDAELEGEIAGSYRDISSDGTQGGRFFAYPFGAVDDRSKEAVAGAGFAGAFGLRQRRLNRSSDRFDLPRVIILAEDRGWKFRAKTAAPRWFALYARVRRKLAAIAR